MTVTSYIKQSQHPALDITQLNVIQPTPVLSLHKCNTHKHIISAHSFSRKKW